MHMRLTLIYTFQDGFRCSRMLSQMNVESQSGERCMKHGPSRGNKYEEWEQHLISSQA